MAYVDASTGAVLHDGNLERRYSDYCEANASAGDNLPAVTFDDWLAYEIDAGYIRGVATWAAINPSAKGRNNLTADVSVYAHHSDVHDGVNVEIDAPAGTHITVHLNDGMLADVVVPE